MEAKDDRSTEGAGEDGQESQETELSEDEAASGTIVDQISEESLSSETSAKSESTSSELIDSTSENTRILQRRSVQEKV